MAVLLLAAGGRFARPAFQAWDGAQECVNGHKLTVSRVLKVRPRHDLQQVAIERRKQAIRCMSEVTIGVGVIQVHTCPHGQHELRKRVPAFWQPGFIWCQVSGNNVHRTTWTWEHPEIPAAPEVRRRIDLLGASEWALGGPAEVGIPGGNVLSRRAVAVAAVAIASDVDQIASQAHHIRVFSGHVQCNRGRLETDLNHLFFVLRAIVIVASPPGRRES